MILPLWILPDAEAERRERLLQAHPELPVYELKDERAWRQGPCDGQIVLWLDGQGLGLRRREAQHPGVVRVDFVEAAWQHRLAARGGAGELVARACGVRQDRKPRVLDLTAGLGGDAWILAAQGVHVDLCERSPWVAMLLADGLQRAAAHPQWAATAARLQLSCGDAHDRLRQLPPGTYDTLYLDPMFPQQGGTARSGKAMDLFQDLLGGDEDADALLAPARRLCPRVVVKRPRLAPPLAGQQPTHVLSGKSVRFDVYAGQLSDASI